MSGPTGWVVVGSTTVSCLNSRGALLLGAGGGVWRGDEQGKQDQDGVGGEERWHHLLTQTLKFPTTSSSLSAHGTSVSTWPGSLPVT